MYVKVLNKIFFIDEIEAIDEGVIHLKGADYLRIACTPSAIFLNGHRVEEIQLLNATFSDNFNNKVGRYITKKLIGDDV